VSTQTFVKAFNLLGRPRFNDPDLAHNDPADFRVPINGNSDYKLNTINGN
jgi:hypothetical protein